jgi:hypothetical protein
MVGSEVVDSRGSWLRGRIGSEVDLAQKKLDLALQIDLAQEVNLAQEWLAQVVGSSGFSSSGFSSEWLLQKVVSSGELRR